MLGFVLVVLLAFPRPRQQQIKSVKPGFQPPPALADFLADLDSLKRSEPVDFSPLHFAEVNVTFGSDLLFKRCDWALSDMGKKRIDDFAQLLWKHSPFLERVDIKGYADRANASDCSALAKFRQSNLSADNWNLLLSSLRAMSVQQALIDSASKDAGPDTFRSRAKLLEAVGKGDLHPLQSGNPDNSKDRRVEILVHFIESEASLP